MHSRHDGGGFSIVPLQVARSSLSRSKAGGEGVKRLGGFFETGGSRTSLGDSGPAPPEQMQLGGLNMTMIKRLILGSVASMLAMGGAQAADLPVKAKAVEYVRVCSLYGAGFFYIPGTDTCIKIGGYLRTDVTINGQTGGAPYWSGGGAYDERYRNEYNDYSRFALTMDARTATEYGVVRI